MSFKHDIVLNFTGISNWHSPTKDWMLKVSDLFPEVPLIMFDYDYESCDKAKERNIHAFSTTEAIMNWLPENTKALVNLTPVYEPVVSPVPTICMLNVDRKNQFWSVDMPNSLGIHGDALKEIGLRNNMFVSNSVELVDLLHNSSSRSSDAFEHDSFSAIDTTKIQKWLRIAVQDFADCKLGPEQPLVSVVTPSYNQGNFLSKTLESVFNQDYKNIEYFVVDGGSTDNTIDVLSKHKSSVRWVSEKDSGYPEAVNKGFDGCSGKYLMWLPSDDMLFSKSSISSLVKAAEESKADVVFGDAFYVDQDDKFLGSYRTACYSPEKLRDWSLICQPAALFRADIFKKIGGLNQGFRCISDYDLWLRMSDAGAKFHRVGRPISCYRIHGESLTVKQKNISYREIFDLQLSRYSVVNRAWVMGAFKEIVLQQNLGLRWSNSKARTEKSAIWNSRFVRRMIKMAFESFLAENPYFQRFIRKMIEPREPTWGRRS